MADPRAGQAPGDGDRSRLSPRGHRGRGLRGGGQGPRAGRRRAQAGGGRGVAILATFSPPELSALAAEAGSSLPGRRRLTRLDNGLTVCLLENRQAPAVTTALAYRAAA